MLKRLRNKLSEKDKALFKLVVWAALVVWMVFFFTYSIIVARKFAAIAPYTYGLDTWGQVLAWVGPVWVVFTSLLIIVGIARYASKKLSPKKGEKE